MFETQKIDSFFSGEKNLLDEEEKIYISRRTKIVRFLKLFLPCLTALLLGLGIALFDFEANSDSTIALAEEEKVYFEKFRMKNTVFEITEKDNQFSTLKASVVEEVKANSKIYDLTNPEANTLDKGREVTARAQKGVYNQKKQLLTLKDSVVANYDKQMEIHTNSVFYNFKTEEGYGNEKITGSGEKGDFAADKFKFDKKNGVITLISNVFLKSKDIEIRTPKQAQLFKDKNKFVAPQATVIKGKDILKGDTLTAYFKDTKTFDIEKADCVGNVEITSNGKKAYADRGEYFASQNIVKLFNQVKIVDNSGYVAMGEEGVFDNNKKIFTLRRNVMVQGKNGYKATAEIGIYDLNKKTFTLDKNVRIDKGMSVITAPKAVYFQAKDEFRLYDDVTVVQEDGIAKAKSGVYYVKKNIAELEKDVVITKKGNVVRGHKAISDFNTSKSRLVAKEGGRVFGKLFENSFKKKKDN